MKGRKILIVILLLVAPQLSWKTESKPVVSYTQPIADETEDIFEEFALTFYENLNTQDLNYEVFKMALKGFINLRHSNKLNNENYLTIADFSKSSSKKRLFLIDVNSQKMIHQSLVAHGRNSGLEFARKFSNRVNSHQSSIGFYTTAETYRGKHGYSLRLDGHEYSNSNARRRAIVIHAADYAGEKFVQNNGRLGRSYGCPSLPKKGYEQVIEKIKGGSCFFIYYPENSYLSKSKLINQAIHSLPSS